MMGKKNQEKIGAFERSFQPIYTKGGKTMPVMDEFKEERAALKNGTPKEKLSYFWDYYKWHVIVTVAVIIAAISMINSILNQKENALYVTIINGMELAPAAEYPAAFAEYAGIDTGTYDVLFDTSMRINMNSLEQDTIASTQKLTTYLAAGQLDAFVSDEDIINQYAYNDTFCDLREILTAEQLKQYEPYFYYLDRAVLNALDEARDSIDYNYEAFTYPDPREPDAMEEPVPVGLYLNTASSFRESYYLSGDAILAVAVNSSNVENMIKFVDFLLQ